MKPSCNLPVIASSLALASCSTMNSDVGLLPNITLEPLYANTNTDAVRGARGATYRRNAILDETARNPCFGAVPTGNPMGGTFIGACRKARADRASTEDVKRYVQAGLAISDNLCQRHLNRLAVRENGLGGLGEGITQGGAATTTIMTVTGTAERSMGVVGSLVQLGSGLTSTARNRLTLSASTEAVYTLIQGKRDAAAREVVADMPADFWTAYRRLDHYHRTCSYPAIRQAINAAVANTGQTAANAGQTAAADASAAAGDYARLIRVTGLMLEDTDGTLDRIAALYAVAQQPATGSEKVVPILTGMSGMGAAVAVAADGSALPVQTWFRGDEAARLKLLGAVAGSPRLEAIRRRATELLAP
jgi:hypothetical protein